MSPETEPLFASEAIALRIGELGQEIADAYRDCRKPPILVAVLKGSAFFLADLVRAIDIPVEFDFMAISSYGPDHEKQGRVRILKDLDRDIADRDVILVEDIIDTGLTASYLVSTLRARTPATVEICALLDKTVRRIAPLEVRFSGFDCPDQFVIGFGMDYRQRFRTLRNIYAWDASDPLSEEVLLREDRRA